MNFAIGAAATATASEAAAAGLQHRKLTDAAQQFEGMLLQEMLKPMKEHESFAGDGAEQSGDGEGDTLSSYGTEALATAIAKGGGLGIARRVVEQVEGAAHGHGGGEEVPGVQNKTQPVLKFSPAAPMN